jgi:hypothetical protein
MTINTQSGTLATIPAGGGYAFDKIGTATPPATNDLLQWVKVDLGVPGSSAPLSASNPMPDNLAQVGGTAIPADGATDAGPSLKVGALVLPNASALSTARSAGQRVPLMADEYGRARVIVNRPKLLGAYKFESGRLTVQASAHASTAGFFWLINPVGSSVIGTVKKLMCTSVPTAATVFASAPRITCERVTFTGTASGASITPAKRDSTDATNTLSVRSASTGLTLAAGAIIGDFTVPPVLTAVGIAVPVDQYLYDDTDEDDYIVLRPGEGIVCRQPDAGTTSDTRLITIYGSWEEK